MLKIKLQYFYYLMGKADLLQKTPMLEKIESKKKKKVGGEVEMVR